MHMTKQIKILFLAANPADTTRLELDCEFRTIQDQLLRGKYRDSFKLLEPQLAARIQDFTAALNRHHPHVVHFCGHGSVAQGLAFEGLRRSGRPVGREELTNLFKVLAPNARLIFLNACHTREQAALLSRMFDYTIGTTSRIRDIDAHDFAGAFYRALFDGATVPGAFLSAQAALDNRVRAISVLSQKTTADNSVPFVSQVVSKVKRQHNCGSVSFHTTAGRIETNINSHRGKVIINPPPSKTR